MDNILTQKLQDWLNTPEKQRDPSEGAEMLLALTRNRALYNSVSRNPARFMAKMVYELRKHLIMRLDNMTVADVARMDQTVMASVAELQPELPVVSTDAELPTAKRARGRRPDHDRLPAHIRDLWDSNLARARKITLLFNELKAMNDLMPCDRYEKLKMLADVESRYRANLAEYDAYVIIPSVNRAEGLPVPRKTIPRREMSPEAQRVASAASKTMSKTRDALHALTSDDSDRRAVLVARLQAATNQLLHTGAAITDETRDDLLSLGIRLNYDE